MEKKQFPGLTKMGYALATTLLMSGTALAADPPAASTTSEAQVDLLVVPRAVTCELNVDNGSAHGTTDGKALVWNVGLTQSGTVGNAAYQSAITDAETTLKRTVQLSFRNPALEDGTLTDTQTDCTVASENGVKLTLKANDADTGATTYKGKIPTFIDGAEHAFNYAVAVNKAAFETAAGSGIDTANMFTSAVESGQTVMGDQVLKLDGTGGIVIKSSTAGSTTPLAGNYPFNVYLQKHYTGVKAPVVIDDTNLTNQDAGINQYRSHFTITAVYN